MHRGYALRSTDGKLHAPALGYPLTSPVFSGPFLRTRLRGQIGAILPPVPEEIP